MASDFTLLRLTTLAREILHHFGKGIWHGHSHGTALVKVDFDAPDLVDFGMSYALHMGCHVALAKGLR